MATEAKFITGFQKIVLIVGTMGIMALDTVPLRRDLVTAFCLFGHNISVTLEAGLVGVVVQQFAMGRGVGIMAFGTLSVFYGGVDEFILELFLKLIVTLQTELSLSIRSQLEFILLGIS